MVAAAVTAVAVMAAVAVTAADTPSRTARAAAAGSHAAATAATGVTEAAAVTTAAAMAAATGAAGTLAGGAAAIGGASSGPPRSMDLRLTGICRICPASIALIGGMASRTITTTACTTPGVRLDSGYVVSDPPPAQAQAGTDVPPAQGDAGIPAGYPPAGNPPTAQGAYGAPPAQGVYGTPATQPQTYPQVGQELFAYPKNGQTDAQQGQDRKECSDWAASQMTAGAGGGTSGRGSFNRAMTACLEGRGYSVR